LSELINRVTWLFGDLQGHRCYYTRDHTLVNNNYPREYTARVSGPCWGVQLGRSIERPYLADTFAL